MISEKSYELLTIEDKTDLLWKHGTFLEEVISYGKYRICIYELNKFLVGVFYNVHNNSVEKIEVLSYAKNDLLKGIWLN